MTTRLSAAELLEVVADADSFECWDSPAVEYPVDQAYADELAAARAKTGLDESVLTGAVSIRGRRVAILLSEFAFLAGSIGVAAGDRLVTAIHRAIPDAVVSRRFQVILDGLTVELPARRLTTLP